MCFAVYGEMHLHAGLYFGLFFLANGELTFEIEISFASVAN